MWTLILGCLFIAVTASLMVYLTNRSRCTLEQACALSGRSERELRTLIKERLLTYRPKYVLFGPRSLLVAGSVQLPTEIAQAFTVLGLAHDASFDAVQQHYRLLAKRHHPDMGGEAEQFRRVQSAYETVKKWLQSKGQE